MIVFINKIYKVKKYIILNIKILILLDYYNFLDYFNFYLVFLKLVKI